MNTLSILNVDRLQEIEQEREATKLDINFQKWVKELRVSQSYKDNSGILNARDMLADYDMNKYKMIFQ
jgi:hypothetical protein